MAPKSDDVEVEVEVEVDDKIVTLEHGFNTFIETHKVFFTHLSIKDIAKMAYYSGVKNYLSGQVREQK